MVHKPGKHDGRSGREHFPPAARVGFGTTAADMRQPAQSKPRAVAGSPATLLTLLLALAAAAAWAWAAASPGGACTLQRVWPAGGQSLGGGNWPTTGKTVHVACTSNGSPYVNYQTLALYGTYRLARRQPGGATMVAFTRILHRTADDALSPFVPTFRAEPPHPECDGGPHPPGRPPCRYVVADRPSAVRQFLEAARRSPGVIQAPWLYLIETDYLFLKPVAAPGAAESAVRSLAFLFLYVTPAAPRLKALMQQLYPPGLGALKEVPQTGPAPVMARVEQWLRLAPRWEGYSDQIEASAEAVQALSWVREMYAFSLAAAVERLDLELAGPPDSPLIVQPPYDLRMGRATQFHYTWGPKLKEEGNDTEFWRFEKRDWRAQRFEDEAPLKDLPPPWRPGWLTPSGRVGRKGAPTSKEDYDFILLEVQTFNRGLQEVGASRWKEVLGREAAAAAARSADGDNGKQQQLLQPK